MRNKFVIIIFVLFISILLVFFMYRSNPKSQIMNLMYLQKSFDGDVSDYYGGAFLNASNRLVVLMKVKNELNCFEIEQRAKTKDIIYKKCDYTLTILEEVNNTVKDNTLDIGVDFVTIDIEENKINVYTHSIEKLNIEALYNIHEEDIFNILTIQEQKVRPVS